MICCTGVCACEGPLANVMLVGVMAGKGAERFAVEVCKRGDGTAVPTGPGRKRLSMPSLETPKLGEMEVEG